MTKQYSQPILSRRNLLIGAGASMAAMTSSSFAATGEASTRGRSAPTGKFDVERFVADCKEASRETDSQSAVKEVLARAISTPRAVQSGIDEPTKGGIQTLYRSPTLTVLNIVWAPLMQLMPHEHNMWALIGIYTGREDNIFWQRRNGQVTAVSASAIAPGSAVTLPKDVIHSVTNPIEKLTGAIHIYGGDFFEVPRSEWDPETLTERDWNIKSAIHLFNQSNERFFEWQNKAACR